MSKAKEETALTTIAGMEGMISVERPQGSDEGVLGNEGIGREDIIIPRLAITAKTAPELDPTSPRYIGGLQFTDLFGSLSKKNYGKGPLLFSILRKDAPRYMEFIPFDQGGGVVDPNVPAGDPRTKFGEIDPATKRAKKPVATKFYDFIIVLWNDIDLNDPMQNVMALSLKSSGIVVAKYINLLIQQRGQKMLYKGIYELRSGSATKNNITYATYNVSNAGWLKPGSVVEKLAAEMYETWKDKTATIDSDTDADEFNPAEYEGQQQQGAKTEM